MKRIILSAGAALVILVGVWLLAKPVSEPKQQKNFDVFGFIREIHGDTIVVDEVEFLSGEKARELGSLDTGCPVKKVEDCIPSLNNDFYIRNISSSTSSYVMSQTAAISFLSSPGSPILSSTTAAEFLKNYPITTRTLKYSQSFHFRGSGQTINWAEEQYTP